MSANDRTVPCGECFQENSYLATKCAYCLADTYRVKEPTEDFGTVGLAVMFLLFTGFIYVMGSALAAGTWVGFWFVLFIGEKLGLESFGLTVLGAVMCWLIFF